MLQRIVEQLERNVILMLAHLDGAPAVGELTVEFVGSRGVIASESIEHGPSVAEASLGLLDLAHATPDDLDVLHDDLRCARVVTGPEGDLPRLE